MTKGKVINASLDVRESTSLAEMTSRNDLTSTAAAEVQGAIIMAMQYPRNENDCLSRMNQMVLRQAFREKAIYRYPRGNTEISGPSVTLARSFARVWGNLRYGFEVVAATDDRVQVRGFAWDMETNMRASQDASFKPLIFRKHAFGRDKPGWIKPDERELRELVNKHGAICERNCLLKVMPFDLIQEIVASIEHADKTAVTNDLERSRRRVIAAFGGFGIVASQLESYLGHPIDESTPEDVVRLRGVWKSIDDGNSTWSEHVRGTSKPNSTVGKAADLLAGKASKGESAKPADHREPSHQRADSAPTNDFVGSVGYDTVRIGITQGLAARDAVEADGDLIDEAKADATNPMEDGSAAADAWRLAFLRGRDEPAIAACHLIDSQKTHDQLRAAVVAAMADAANAPHTWLIGEYAEETEQLRFNDGDAVIEL